VLTKGTTTNLAEVTEWRIAALCYYIAGVDEVELESILIEDVISMLMKSPVPSGCPFPIWRNTRTNVVETEMGAGAFIGLDTWGYDFGCL
jgi:hypothetical protein